MADYMHQLKQSWACRE